jgi:pyochelin synthetase
MMIQPLLAELHQRGIKLRLRDGRLDVAAPAGALTEDLRERLRAHRDELIAVLGESAAAGGLPEITARPRQRHEPFPLTDVQHAYWVGRDPAVELGGVCTHYYFELDSDGLDPARLTESLNAVISRHDMLRAVVAPDGTQRVLASVPEYRIAVADLSALSPSAQAAGLARVRAEMGSRAQSPENWPLFEIRASVRGGGRLRLHLSFNLLIIDYFSLLVLFADWRNCYCNPGRRLDPLPVAFRDYVLAQEAAREGSRYRKAEEYWRGRLADLPPPPDLPLAHQPRHLGPVRFTRRHTRLSRERSAALRRTAQQRGLTPSIVLLTAFADVLQTWSAGQQPCTLNLTLFDRPPVHTAIGEIIGDFTSLTMLAVDGSQDASFTVRAERNSAQLMLDLEHISYSGVRVLRERARVAKGGLGAAMPVVFTSAIGASSLRGADDQSFFGERVYGISQTPQVWLDHQVLEEQGGLTLIWDAVEDLFPPGLLDDMFTAYRELLGRLCDTEAAWEEEPRRPLPLPHWQGEERARANATAAAIAAKTLCELVEAQARKRPNALAVISGDALLSYREVTAHASRLAGRLAESGASKDTLVGIVLEKGWEQVAAVLGVAASGAAYLPIEPQWPQARRDHLIAVGGVCAIVTSPDLASRMRFPDGVEVLTFADDLGCHGRPDVTGPSPADLAYVIFTSGSTGQPKGVMIDHQSAANTIQDVNSRWGIGPGDRVLALSALSFDLSVYDIFGTLAAGATIVMPAQAGMHDPGHWTELMQRHQVTVWNSVPALMDAWLEHRTHQAVPARAPGLRLVMLSGDWVPVALPGAVRQVCPQADVISLGGATEAAIWSVFYPIGEVPASWTRIPYGKPMANQVLHVYDHRLESCPVWVAGEIYIGGTGVARGYWGDHEQTAQRFIIHPVTGERLYRTGDMGRYLPGGDIEFLGRQDFQVKLNGYRIELEEIGAALRRQQGVTQALAHVAPHPVTGRRQLVGYVVAEPGATVDPAGLRKTLEALLPGYMVPQQYVQIPHVPLSANGKVDLSALPPPPDGTGSQDAAAERADPRDDLEAGLLRIWRDVLELDGFGVSDNIFELGADSLHAMRILARLRDDLGFAPEEEEGLLTLMDNPTIAELAVALRESTGSAG